MATKTKFYRTYLIKINAPSGAFYYAGQHLSYKFEARLDRYLGSGTILNHFKRKYGTDICKIRWLKDFRYLEDVNIAEVELISKLKRKYGKRCLNLAPGGNLPGFKWSEDKKKTHKILLNNPNVKSKMCSSQKKAQNNYKRKLRQSEIMNNFYSNLSSRKIVSQATSKAQRIALHWKLPLKKQIFDLWISLGKPKQGEVVKALNGIYSCTSSSLKLLIYEFRDYGYIEPL
ncbi:hypothetical protein KNT87_gp020 [Erwinia phage Cronus]|uniref:Homing endonuclease n=1 Tax=Erwinia phage Cronus TaxID=2163633 RepID=A0A2S1GM57_9CAUD|nr:hypothetical protein KNT87_gp020 [Erwinia phage Cronus]AWD90459.1 hypothetical protein [Erwinia phage Cronus]